MNNNRIQKLPRKGFSQTSGLSSIYQLIDTTSNELFSFKNETSIHEETRIIYPQPIKQEEEYKEK